MQCPRAFTNLRTQGDGHPGRREDVEILGNVVDPDEIINTYGALIRRGSLSSSR